MEIKLKSVKGPKKTGDDSFYDYVLKITVIDGAPEVEVKVAISHSQSLEIFCEKTPFEHKFTSNRYYIFYESLNKASIVRAELYSNQFSNSQWPSSTSGSSGRGKFIRNPAYDIKMCGGDG